MFATATLPLDCSAILGPDIGFWEPTQGHLNRKEILTRGREADAIIATVADPMDKELFDSAPNLKIIANFAVGFDNIDVREATNHGIVVTNTPDVLTDATAELTFALIFSAARRIVEGDALIRSGKWSGWKPTELLGAELWGRTLGIIGYGRIGKAVAKRAAAFGMHVVCLSRGEQASSGTIEFVPLDELLERSDFVTLHCPLNEDSRSIIDSNALSIMKKSAILVNTARGACIDEEALVQALYSGEIAAAALDVFDGEPVINPSLLSCPKTVFTPHIGSATVSARKRMGELCANAVRLVCAGESPPNILNPDVYGKMEEKKT